MQNKLAIFLLGGPGAGKSTQADLLAEKLDFKHVNTGDIVRKEIKKNLKEKAIYDSGELNTPVIVIKWLKQEIKKINSNLIFSGSPRTLYEAKKLTPFLKKLNYKIKIFNISVSPEQSLIRNTKRARGVLDKPEKIKHRIKVYQEDTKPVLDFFGKKVIKINGEQPIKQVHKDICNATGWQDSGADNAGNCAGCQAKCPFAGPK